MDKQATISFPEGSGRVWIGCEAAVMRDIRRHLLHERGMDRTHAHTQGYWKYGATNHPDNDRGQDVDRGTYQRKTP